MRPRRYYTIDTCISRIPVVHWRDTLRFRVLSIAYDQWKAARARCVSRLFPLYIEVILSDPDCFQLYTTDEKLWERHVYLLHPHIALRWYLDIPSAFNVIWPQRACDQKTHISRALSAHRRTTIKLRVDLDRWCRRETSKWLICCSDKLIFQGVEGWIWLPPTHFWYKFTSNFIAQPTDLHQHPPTQQFTHL